MPDLSHIEISLEEAEIVFSILRARVADRPVWAFGSRTNGRARRRSDLDLAIGGDGALSLRTCSELAEDFDRSDLPFRVDVVDLNAIMPEFRARIEKDFIAMQAGTAATESVLA